MKEPTTCPTSVSLTRSCFEGAFGLTDEHLERCDRCRAEIASIDRLVQLGKQLPDGRPSLDRVNAVYDEVLRAAGSPAAPATSRPRRAWLLGAAAAVIALILGIYFLTSTAEPGRAQPPRQVARRAAVHAHKGADPVFLGSQPDEIVRLAQGTITVEVAPLEKGERFRVITGDAEVEVRGTSFDVKVENDSLLEVSVISGQVAVRPRGREAVMLGPGERWTRTEPAPALAQDDPVEESSKPAVTMTPAPRKVGPAPKVRKRRTRAPIPPQERQPLPEIDNREPRSAVPISPIRTASSAETAFTAGWAALVNGNPKAAADHFDDAVSRGGSHPIAEDASFWRAVANDRKGAGKRATAQLQQFLEKYPGSSRAGEASCMLGWKLLDAGNLDRAERLFHRAAKDRSARIRKSAEKGLAEINARR